MFRTLIYQSSGACDYSVELPHSGIRVEGFSLQQEHNSNPTTMKLQHTSNQEQYDQRGNSTK